VKNFKTRIAAGATILGLGGLTGLALSAGHQKASQPVAAKPLVRTKVIVRTIHVIKHIKPKHPVGASPAAGAAHGGAAGGTSGAGVATGSSSTGSVPSSSSAPVVTHTSGSHGGGSSGSPVVTHTSGGGGGGEHDGGDHGD
jgi:hypothetical protein